MSSGSIRIIQLPEKSSVNTDDYMAVDSSANGTKKVKFIDLLDNNLSAQNKAADAQATGEAINDISARVDNMINTQTNAEVTTLWTGLINLKNETANLSESVSNFDFIDVYCGSADTVFARQHVSSGSVHFELQAQNMSDDASVQFMRWWETGLTISGTTATITKAIRCYWDDFSTVPVVSQATGGGVDIIRIDGVKIGHIENDEIVDARVGANGKRYLTLGDAIRTPIGKLESYFVEGINLFNPNDPDLVENVELVTNGTTNAKTGYFASGFIPIEAGKTVCCHYPTGTYGSASSFVWYNANKERIGYSAVPSSNRLVDTNGHNYIRYTFTETPEATYFRLTGHMPDESYYMYVYADEMPDIYVPYTTDVELADDVKVDFANIKNLSVSKEDTDFIKVNSKNLVDLSQMEVGIINNSSSNGNLNSTATNWRTSDYIAVKSGAVYSALICGGVYYGSGYKGVPYYDSNKTYKGHIVPSTGITTTSSWATLTIPNDCAFIRLSYPKASVESPKLWRDTQMFEGVVATQPTTYLHYNGDDRLQNIGLTDDFSREYNCLFGKKAIWNGDSICAADNDTQGGWVQRIGKANGMSAQNYGISGGCIAENVGTAHSVCGTLDTMLSAVPDADYILIEGGTNDADLLGTDGIGSFDANDFSDTYINALDRNTFSGALESIFYRLVTQMKGKHIGYIIPQKMGHTEVLVTRRRTYFDRAIQICQKWGIPYIDLWNDYYFNWRLSAHWNQSMTGAENENAGNLYLDGQHLTTTGYAIESPLIAEWMKGI